MQVDLTEAQITEKNIVTEAKFSTTDYYLILDAFTKGMKLAEKYQDATNCQTYLTNLFDSYNDMYINDTATGATWDGTLMFNAKQFSNEFRNTYYYCFLLFKQIGVKAI